MSITEQETLDHLLQLEQKLHDPEMRQDVYLITGTSRGLGQALVAQLAAQGHKVFGLQRNLDEKVEGVHYLECDLSNIKKLPDMMDHIFDEIDLKKTSSITLINNAAVLNPIKSIQNASLEEISENITVNLTALIALTSVFIQKTQKENLKKTVINISSGAAQKAYDGWSLYCSAKAGVDMFTRCVGLEQSRQSHPVTIFSFYPNVMDTGMQKAIRDSSQEDFPSVERFIDYKKNQKLLSPDFVAKTLLDFSHHDEIESGGIYNIEDMM